MKQRIALLFLVGAAGLSLALWWFAGDARRRGIEPTPAEAGPGRVVEAQTPLVPAPATGAEEAPPASVRKALEDSAPAPRAAAAPATPHPKQVARVGGRCVDGAGQPLAAVEITGPGIADGRRSATDGSFELEVDLSGELRQSRRLQFARKGLGTRSIQALLRSGEPHDLGDVVLVPAGRVSGRVVDAHGLLLGGAQVRVEEALDLASGSRFTGPSDAIATGEAGPNGSFLLEDVPPGAVRVWAGQEEWLWSATERLELAPGGQLAGLELVLEPLAPEDTIRLVVLDPAGAPVPRAEISYRYELSGRSGSGSTQADENGRFKQFLDVRAAYSFQASDPEERYRPAVAYDVPPGTHDLILQLGEKRSFRLRVEDEKGAPVARFSASVRQVRGQFGTSHEPPEDGSLRAGEVEIVTPPAAFELSVEAEGFELAQLGPFEPASVPEELVARLKVLPGVRGRVRSADGPLPGAKVSLHEAMGADESYSVNGFPCVVERFSEAEAQTDEDGEYVLTLRKSDDWFVRAEAPGFAPADLGPLRLEAGVGAKGVDLVLGRGGAIAGRVIVPAGEEPSGHIVGLSRGDGFGFTGRTDASGEYRFEGLTPGKWQVVSRQDEISTNSTSSSRSSGTERAAIPFDCEVYEGRTTHFDLDLRALRLATLSGRFLLGGAAPRDGRATLSPRDPALHDESASLDPNGRFRLTTTAAGNFDLVFRGELGSAFVHASTAVVLAPGENDYEADVPVGGLHGRLGFDQSDGVTRLDLISEAYPGLLFSADLRADSEGLFSADVLPAGPARVEYRTASGEQGTKQVDIPKGGVAEVVVP